MTYLFAVSSSTFIDPYQHCIVRVIAEYDQTIAQLLIFPSTGCEGPLLEKFRLRVRVYGSVWRRV